MWMNEHLPNPENLLTIFIITCCLGIMQIFAKKFGSGIRKKMTPMREALEQIGDRNLDFKVNYSGVREIDECLVALDDMRYALKTSLQKQWETEQEKSRQMSALAHDIKTPLTVVRGNSELLLETELTDEQKNYADYISGSALQIQNYVQTLIEVTKSQEGIEQTPVKVKVADILADIKKQTMGLSEVYQLQINWREECKNEVVISVVYDHVVRAVMNAVRNAAEHTPEGGVINISASYRGGKLIFIIEDSGSGFTPEALAHGTEQFFMDDSSRTGGSHYGIGLFFAKKVAEEHGGDIVLANSKEIGGAKVEISFMSQEYR
jgi:signal transduction histidine kinase